MRTRFSARLVPAALATITAVVLATACGSSTSTGPASLAGTWNLTTVNGSSLPAVIQTFPPDTAWLTNGTVVLTDSTWDFSATVGFSLAGVHTDTTEADSGSYTMSGNTLSMRSVGDTSVTTATVNGSTITVAAVGFASGTPLTMVFTKQ